MSNCLVLKIAWPFLAGDFQDVAMHKNLACVARFE